jgi:hypothetical protein
MFLIKFLKATAPQSLPLITNISISIIIIAFSSIRLKFIDISNTQFYCAMHESSQLIALDQFKFNHVSCSKKPLTTVIICRIAGSIIS